MLNVLRPLCTSARITMLLLVMFVSSFSANLYASDDRVDPRYWDFLYNQDIRVDGFSISYAVYKRDINNRQKNHIYKFLVWNGYEKKLRFEFIAGVGQGKDPDKWQVVLHKGAIKIDPESHGDITFHVTDEEFRAIQGGWRMFIFDPEFRKY